MTLQAEDPASTMPPFKGEIRTAPAIDPARELHIHLRGLTQKDIAAIVTLWGSRTLASVLTWASMRLARTR